MISIIEQTLSFDGLVWLIIAVIFAGLVRGFVGFGTALIFMPIAASVTSPIWAIIIMMSFDIFGPLALLPRAWRDGEPAEVSLLVVGAIVGLPIGVYFLTQIDPTLFRWLVSILTLLMLISSGKRLEIQESTKSFYVSVHWLRWWVYGWNCSSSRAASHINLYV